MKKLKLMVFALAGLVLSSCLSDKFGDTTIIPDAKSNFKLRVTLDALESELAITRATVAPTDDEEKVQNLALLFFDRTGDASGQFRGAVLLNDGPYQMNADIPISFDGTTLDGMTAYNILIMGNGNEMYLGMPVSDWVGTLAGMTEQKVYDESLAKVSGASDNSHAIPADKLLMTARASRAAEQSLVSATMTRVVSRFDVVNSKYDVFDLVSTSIWNAYPETSVFGGGVNDYSADRTKRFYGVDNSGNVGEGGRLNDIIGGLYSFPNRVVTPGQADTKTTCLIVGLRPIENIQVGGETWATGDLRYYRANISPKDSAQDLKRNNAYKLTVRGVSGIGEKTEQEAYSGGANNLSYVINYWDLDDDGLIVYDGTNLLAIPTKTVRLATEGETRELTIFTFGSGTLAIKNQNYNGSSAIRSSLNGNTLSIVAQPLGTDTERTGFIELSFAGLTATINVIQSPSGDRYLEVVTPTGSGIPAFAATAGAEMDGVVTVKASGPWTATLHMDGFSFSDPASTNDIKTTLTSAEAPGNTFKLYTSWANTSTSPREAFILIKLDEDPDNFNSVLLLTQKAAGTINVTPSSRNVTFNANGSLDTSVSPTQEFRVYPTVENGEIYEWEAKIVALDGTEIAPGDQVFEFYNPVSGVAGTVLSSTSNIEGNRIGVRPKGENNGTNVLRAKLRIYLKNQTDQYTDIELVQRSYKISHTPGDIDPVSVKGGMSEVITLAGDASLTWTATVTTTTTTSGRTLKLHPAILVDENGNALNMDTPQPITQGFRVMFPKVYYPNRSKAIVANVEINITGSSISYPITVRQDMLTAPNISLLNMVTGWGQILHNNYDANAYYNVAFQNRTMYGPSSKYVVTNNFTQPSSSYGASTGGPIPTSYNHINANRYDAFNDLTYAAVEEWRAKDIGSLVIEHDQTNDNGFTNPSSTLYKFGVTRAGTLSASTPLNAANATGTRVGQYLTLKGPFTTSQLTGLSYSVDGINSAAAINRAKTPNAVPIIGTDDSALLIIDPENRIVYMGESQIFAAMNGTYTDFRTGMPSNSKDYFLANTVAYVLITAQYSSHFSDLLIDGFTLPAPFNTALPAPWDDAWKD